MTFDDRRDSPRLQLVGLAALGAATARSSGGRASWGATALAGLASYEPLRRLLREQRALETQDFRDLARKTLTATFLALPEELGSFVRAEAGLHAFVVQWPLRPTARPYLGPVARFRLGARPPSSRIPWHEGVGAMGEAWRLARPVAVELSAPLPDQTAWAGMSDESRLSLSYDEYLFLRRYYGAVVATPILVDDAVRGVVVLDAPPGTLVTDLIEEPVLSRVGEAALILAQGLAAADPDLYPGRGWAASARLLWRAFGERPATSNGIDAEMSEH